ncbi:LexA family protein [Microbulbifer sp. ANSA001]|uniref:LexA family protein n=1 Tax=Microbulbifer sp. ANSA001 TaxID=3243358 RepID=UPI0040426592
MTFIEVEAEIRACLDTIDMTADTADPKLRDMLKVQVNNLNAATNALVDELNSLNERQAQLRELLKLNYYEIIPLYSSGVSCGFPSPANDHKETALSFDEHLITKPAATFMSRANGDSRLGVGIFDRSLIPVNGDVEVVVLDGHLACKILDRGRGRLLSANEKYPPIPIWEGQELIVVGVVKASIRYHGTT